MPPAAGKAEWGGMAAAPQAPPEPHRGGQLHGVPTKWGSWAQASSPCFAWVAEIGESTKWDCFARRRRGEKSTWMEGLVVALGLFLGLRLLQKLQDKVVAGTGTVGVMGRQPQVAPNNAIGCAWGASLSIPRISPKK